MQDKNRASAFRAADRIRAYWRNHPNGKALEVNVHPGTYEIRTNMRNGYPPESE